MLPEAFRAMFDDRVRGDDRLPSAAYCVDVPSSKPPIFRRRTTTIIALIGIVLIIYGTLMPFQIDPQRTLTWKLEWYRPVPGDTVANFLMYIPIGIFLRLMVRRRGSCWLMECLSALSLAFGISYLTEVAQTILAARCASYTDTIVNMCGAFVGICFAPMLQRLLRNFHGWLYNNIRHRPFESAATVLMLCICIHALFPFDVHPTKNQVSSSIDIFYSMPVSLPWTSVNDVHAALSTQQLVDKTVAAGSYGLLALFLLLSAREAGRSSTTAAWYAFSRSALLVLVIEAIQLFTISHVTDPRDVLLGWLCCAMASGIGLRLAMYFPQIHNRPMLFIKWIVMISGILLIGWAGATVFFSNSRGVLHADTWLPMVSNFHHSWNSLLGHYVIAFFRYGIAAALLILWYRSKGRSFKASLIIIGTLTVAWLVTMIQVFYRQKTFDSAQLLLAVLAGWLLSRVDTAIFGKRQIPATTDAQLSQITISPMATDKLKINE